MAERTSDIDELIEKIVGCAKQVRKHLTPGFEEKVYKNAMFIELRESGLPVETEVSFKVFYRNYIVGDYRAYLSTLEAKS